MALALMASPSAIAIGWTAEPSVHKGVAQGLPWSSVPPMVPSGLDRREQEQESVSRNALRPELVHERAVQRAAALELSQAAIQRQSLILAAASRQRALTKAGLDMRKSAVASQKKRAAAAAAARISASKKARSFRSGKAARVQPRASGSVVAAAVPPVAQAVIGARFGAVGSWSRYHTGLDFRAGAGTPIRAAKAGIVTYAGNAGDWAGIHVVVRHADGYSTQSSHMSSVTVANGQRVAAGQVIGAVGSTGRSFGAHLHFELYPAGVRPGDVYRAVDPLPWLTSR